MDAYNSLTSSHTYTNNAHVNEERFTHHAAHTVPERQNLPSTYYHAYLCISHNALAQCIYKPNRDYPLTAYTQCAE